jgi:hypothetical protein
MAATRLHSSPITAGGRSSGDPPSLPPNLQEPFFVSRQPAVMAKRDDVAKNETLKGELAKSLILKEGNPAPFRGTFSRSG